MTSGNLSPDAGHTSDVVCREPYHTPIIYSLILLGGAIVLALRHAADERPSVRSKRLVGVAVVASVVVPWFVAAAVLQVGACVYVIVYRMAADELPKPDAK